MPPNDLESVLDPVREFGYRVNRLVITCRTQAQKILKFNGKVTDSEIKQLLNRHILDNNWHEVFRLIAERNGNE